jgi:site-specific DNA-cytosine methylase
VAQLEEKHRETLGDDERIIQEAQSGMRLREESGTLRTCLNHQHVVEPQGIEQCDSALKQYEKFYESNGYIPEFFNPYNCSELQEVAPTLTAQCTRINASSTVLKLEPQMIGHIDLQGLPIREATKQGYAIAQEGDAVNFQFPDSNTRRGRIGKQIANTLEASGINQGVVTPKYRIRKLTPRECFRLQGFPDAEFDKLMANGLSNSQLYKMAGNAVTVNVISALGKRLLPQITQ